MRLPGLTIAFALLAVLPAASSPARVDTQSSAAIALDVQRALFDRSLAEVQRGQRTNIDEARAALARYPLLPYLEAALLLREMATADGQEVRSFLNRYPGSALADDVRSTYLRQLVGRGAQSELLELYDDASADEPLRCSAGVARVALGQAGALAQTITPYWTAGRSAPPGCAELEARWLASGGASDVLVQQRIDAALARGAVDAARTSLTYLSAAARPWEEKLLEVHARPSVVLALAPDANPRSRNAIGHGLARLASRDLAAADGRWRALRSDTRFDVAIRQRVIAALVAAAWQQGYRRPLEAMPELADGSHAALLESIIRDAIERKLWAPLAVVLGDVPSYRKAEPRWRYWHARALELSGAPARRVATASGGADVAVLSTAASAAAGAAVGRPGWRDLFTELATDRSYYGFMAADRVRVTPTLEPRIPVPNNAQLTEMAARPAVRRTLELLAIGRRDLARVEWRHLARQATPAQMVAGGTLAARAGYHDFAVQTVIDGKLWDALELRFPTIYGEHVLPAAAARGLDPSWIYAITRQESAFKVDARSPVGALGLMQLMPATGESTARSLGIALRSQRDLLRPEINVRLGTEYLAQMHDRFRYHRALASASYNAGPGRVQKWLGERPASPVDVWIESIPFAETRQYVQNVLLYSHIYSRMLGTRQPFLYDHER